MTWGDLCAGQFLCPGAPRGSRWAKGHNKRGGGKRVRWEKKLKKKKKKKKDGGCPLQHAHTTQSRLSKDNQLRCKCSPEGGGTERSPVSSPPSTKCVCGEVSWWQLNAPNLYTSASLCCTYLLKRLIHAFILVAKWFTALPLSLTHTHTLHKHIWTPSRGWEVLTQSPFLLCWKAGKTVVRHGGFSAHVERLMGDYRSVARAGAEQGPSCWTGSHLRHGPAPPAVLLSAWPAVGWGRKVKTDTDTTKSKESFQCVRTACKSDGDGGRREQSETYKNKAAENERVECLKGWMCLRLRLFLKWNKSRGSWSGSRLMAFQGGV